MAGAGSIPIIGPLIDLIMGQQAEEDKMRAIRRQQDLIEQIGLPDFAKQGLTPELYNRPEEAQGQQLNIDPRFKDMQMQALQNMMDRASGLSDAQSDLSRAKAIREANQMAQGREQAAATNARARGVGGGGLEFALGQQGAQEAANRAQEAGLSGAYQAALEKMQAQNNYIQGLGNLRGQETDLAGRNADIINSFNMANVNARNQTNMANTDLGNQAQQFNLQRGDKNSQQQFTNQLSKRQLAGQLLNPEINTIDAGAANRSDAIGGMFGGIANLATGGMSGLLGMGAPSAGLNNKYKRATQWGGGGGW